MDEIKKNKPNRWIIFAFIGILLAACLAYLSYHPQTDISSIQNKSFDEGYISGVNDLLNYLAETSPQCQPIYINGTNRMVGLIDIECLDKGLRIGE